MSSSVPKSPPRVSSASQARSAEELAFIPESLRPKTHGVDPDLKPTRQYYEETNVGKPQMPTNLMPRPKFNTSGKPALISINSHKILEYPNKTVFQYDVR